MQAGNTYRWNVLQTKVNQEEKVSFNLDRKRIQYYFPVINNKANALRFERDKFIPLFPSYVFVYVDEVLLEKALKVKGVLNCMYWLNRPAVVSQNEISVIKKLLKENKYLQLLPSRIELHKSVEITYFLNEVSSGSSTKQIKVILPSLGYCLIGDANHSFQLINVVNDFVI